MSEAAQRPTAEAAHVHSVGVAIAMGLLVALLYGAIDAAAPTELRFVKYNLAADQHLEGNLPSVRRMDLSPFYFETIALLGRIAPASDTLALEATGWLHRVATFAAASLLYLVLAWRLPRRYAVAGVVALAAMPHFMVYARVFEPELVLLVALLGYVVATDRDARWAALLAGVCAAAATASRPTFLLLFLALGPLGFALRGMRGRPLVVRCVWFFLPLLICGVWLGARAQSLVGDPFAPVMNPGTVFFEGNHPLSRGTSAAYPISVASLIVLDPNVPDEAHNRYRKVARESLRRGLTTAEVNAFWAGRAWNFIEDEPGRAVRNVFAKGLRALRDDRWHDVGTAEKLEAHLPIVPWLYGALVSLALLGVGFEARAWREQLALLAFGAAQIAVMLVFYVSARQQMVLLPSLVYFGLAGVRGVVRSIRGNRRAAAGWGLLWLGLVLVVFARDDTTRDHIHSSRGGLEADRAAERLSDAIPLAAQHHAISEVLAAASWLARDNLPGNIDREGRSPFADAARRIGARPEADFFDEFDRGTLELQAGDLDAARSTFEALAATGRRAYRTYAEASDPAFYLGRIAALQGQPEEAESWLSQALDRTPGDPFVLAEMSALAFGSNHRETLERYYSPLDAELLIAEALLVHARVEQAAEHFGRHLRTAKRSHRAAVGFAAALGASGQVERGVEVYRRSLERASTPVLWNDQISALYRTWAAAHPDDPAIRLEAAEILGFHGRFREAEAMLEKLDTGDDRVRASLIRMRDSIAAGEATEPAASEAN
ncbi:MAG: hypothetical protein QF570_18555 [Myxococcota bacterium]|nr:hypothetical protein [Myxococcota bacterium]